MNEDLIIKKLIDHDEQLLYIREHMVTKGDISKVTELLEWLVTAVKKIQDDHTFAIEWLKRLQDQFDRQDEEIRKIKLLLKLA
ncbi:hypothetical protein HY628_02840 [Candidatus Uhrbacteria bacterium]|nr:hypothetical protein [Candidatus Uhrbacteria bacterium]